MLRAWAHTVGRVVRHRQHRQRRGGAHTWLLVAGTSAAAVVLVAPPVIYALRARRPIVPRAIHTTPTTHASERKRDESARPSRDTEDHAEPVAPSTPFGSAPDGVPAVDWQESKWTDPRMYKELFREDAADVPEDERVHLCKAAMIISLVFAILIPPPHLQTRREWELIERAAKKMVDKDASMRVGISASVEKIEAVNAHLFNDEDGHANK